MGLNRSAGAHPGARYQRPGPRRRGGDADSGFDTNVSIATGELSSLIRDLVEALDGEGRTGMGDLCASLAGGASN